MRNYNHTVSDIIFISSGIFCGNGLRRRISAFVLLVRTVLRGDDLDENPMLLLGDKHY